jgi:hypothetical protein
VKAVATICPGAQHIRTGLHRARGKTTNAIERSHVPMRDRLRNSRGLKRTETGQHFVEGFEAIRHLRRDGRPGADPRSRARSASAALNVSTDSARLAAQRRLAWLVPTQHSPSFRTPRKRSKPPLRNWSTFSIASGWLRNGDLARCRHPMASGSQRPSRHATPPPCRGTSATDVA